ncbi:phosphoethanolamine transferase domain-containing protein [Hoeflea alexandrii]|uniref:phosphoethanolamine transferase domain-containing protein n=1 Tax=Hoeflea alexandrii TaxID=288436 RepID=UPI00226F1A92|nr:phosphoethanolamine transferase domain-containing protein [Hoeflea alexandrii]MCY0153943.1 phosphoethanolamine transferase domain-containing protein [Hoeflea alexandrii]
MSALLTALSISVTVKYITKPIYIVALFSAAAASWIMQKLGVIIDNHMIRNATQTTPAGARPPDDPGLVDETLSRDKLFHTVLGLMDVNAKHYDQALDVTSGCRAPSR